MRQRSLAFAHHNIRPGDGEGDHVADLFPFRNGNGMATDAATEIENTGAGRQSVDVFDHDHGRFVEP